MTLKNIDNDMTMASVEMTECCEKLFNLDDTACNVNIIILIIVLLIFFIYVYTYYKVHRLRELTINLKIHIINT